jgi:hypothetical protein
VGRDAFKAPWSPMEARTAVAIILLVCRSDSMGPMLQKYE